MRTGTEKCKKKIYKKNEDHIPKICNRCYYPHTSRTQNDQDKDDRDRGLQDKDNQDEEN